MILSSALALYAGGPGSGCNPAAGKCGRQGLQRLFSRVVKNHAKALKSGYIQKKSMIPIAKIKGAVFAHDSLEDVTKAKVSRYAEAMLKGKAFSPILVVKRGGIYRMEDGHHRLAALKKSFPKERGIPSYVFTPKGYRAFLDGDWDFE